LRIERHQPEKKNAENYLHAKNYEMNVDAALISDQIKSIRLKNIERRRRWTQKWSQTKRLMRHFSAKIGMDIKRIQSLRP